MSYFSALDVSSSGLSVQRARMDLISQNIANVNTTRTEDGTPYRRQALLIGTEGNDFATYLTNAQGKGASAKAMIKGVYEDGSELQRVYEPNHPDADEEGYVLKPNVNIVTEMVDMISATRSYEANITAMDSSKNMAMQAIRIGQ